ncbi:MAG: type VI secretion system ATPase TssH [Nitrospinae bacterium]|nr:type VI secretion system ATPase TssH [Nitrospinota bacterium]
MISELKTLVGKLNPVCRQSLEEAAGLCVSQTHYNVELEHFLIKLLEKPNTDLRRLLRYYEIDLSLVERELTQAVDKLKRGNNRTPALSPHLPRLFQEAWVCSSLIFGGERVRSGAMLLALLDHDYLRGIILESSETLRRISRQSLKDNIRELLTDSNEDADEAPPAPAEKPSTPERAEARRKPAKTPALDQYTNDLTARAKAGQIDPIAGRDFEIRQVIDILTRRRQNNPILTGEAGVGKTAVAEGFALRIAAGDVPPPLKNVSLRALDLGLLQAGAGVKGEFENRLKTVIQEVKSSPQPIILFIDEAHTMIGAGGQAGQGDAANLLKPALARGELRTIAATTWSEYKKYFEKDPALTRRFQVVQVKEPDEDTAIEMLRGTAVKLEEHHCVRILHEAIADAVRLSHRYISGRQLPDKAVSVLDTACARVALGQTGTPPQIEDAARGIEQFDLELQILNREQASGQNHRERVKELNGLLKKVRAKKERLENRWKQELQAVKEIRDRQAELEKIAEGKNAPKTRLAPLRNQLSKSKKKLAALQGDDPMVSTCVDSHAVAAVISGWTGIPVGKMQVDDIKQILSLKDKLEKKVVGQSWALETISRRIQTSKAGMEDPGKPVGVFLLVGPSGVGKTETAHALADLLFGGDRNMVRINMSEYQEAHTVSGLKGSPPGYVGFGQGGVLTEAVRRAPYSVVLLDEVEKAHPDVMEIFYQAFDKGIMEDAEGMEIDFKNTVILLTSNVGTEAFMKLCADPEKQPPPETMVNHLRPHLLKHFQPAFLGRLAVVPYYPLGREQILNIVKLKLSKVQERFRENHRAELTFAGDLVSNIASRCTEADSGARNIDHILTQTLLPQLSREILQIMADGNGFSAVHVSLDSSGQFNYQLEP